MKRILSLVLLLAMVCMLFACNKPEETPDNGGTQTPNEKTYSFAVVVDSALGRGNKTTNIGLAIVFDADGKIVAARFDSNEVAPELNADGTVKAVESVVSKVETGADYTGMPAGDWKTQAGIFENAIVGKTAEEVANLEATAYAGCTMASSVPVFKALVAKAAALENKVTFTTASTFTTGIAMDMTVAANRNKTAAEVTADIAGVVVADGKVLACAIDSVIQSYAITDGETKTLTAPETPAVSKNEQGDGYVMPAGSWLNQAKAFCAAIVNLDAAGLEAFAPVSDALASAGCTMQNTTAGYKVTIVAAFGYAR
ncbi:MAG: hypothetical protein IKC72_05535 [Clostridia bacterium]|nr:hypothetical protein [Clostridia bacterium]